MSRIAVRMETLGYPAILDVLGLTVADAARWENEVDRGYGKKLRGGSEEARQLARDALARMRMWAIGNKTVEGLGGSDQGTQILRFLLGGLGGPALNENAKENKEALEPWSFVGIPSITLRTIRTFSDVPAPFVPARAGGERKQPAVAVEVDPEAWADWYSTLNTAVPPDDARKKGLRLIAMVRDRDPELATQWTSNMPAPSRFLSAVTGYPNFSAWEASVLSAAQRAERRASEQWTEAEQARREKERHMALQVARERQTTLDARITFPKGLTDQGEPGQGTRADFITAAIRHGYRYLTPSQDRDRSGNTKWDLRNEDGIDRGNGWILPNIHAVRYALEQLEAAFGPRPDLRQQLEQGVARTKAEQTERLAAIRPKREFHRE